MYDMPSVEPSKPTLYLSDKELTDIPSWEVGNKYYVVLELELIGIEKVGEHIYGRFNVEKALSIEKLNDKDFEKVVAKVKSSK